jgi:hypothetical protein
LRECCCRSCHQQHHQNCPCWSRGLHRHHPH